MLPLLVLRDEVQTLHCVEDLEKSARTTSLKANRPSIRCHAEFKELRTPGLRLLTTWFYYLNSV